MTTENKFKKGQFDLIIILTMHHISDPERIIHQSYKLLKKNGTIYIFEPLFRESINIQKTILDLLLRTRLLKKKTLNMINIKRLEDHLPLLCIFGIKQFNI